MTPPRYKQRNPEYATNKWHEKGSGQRLQVRRQETPTKLQCLVVAPRFKQTNCKRRLSGWLSGKESTCNTRDPGDLDSIAGLGRYLGGGYATHSSVLAWRIPWTEEPGRLSSIGLQSQTWLKQLSTHACMHMATSGTSFLAQNGK